MGGWPVRIPFRVTEAWIRTRSLQAHSGRSGECLAAAEPANRAGFQWAGRSCQGFDRVDAVGGSCAPLPSGPCVQKLLGTHRHTHRLAGTGERDGSWFPPRILNDQEAEDRCVPADPRTLDGDVEPLDRLLVCRYVMIGQEPDDPCRCRGSRRSRC
jgi:hypothetical protein